MTVVPFSDITSSGAVVSTTFTATALVYTITSATINGNSSTSSGRYPGTSVSVGPSASTNASSSLTVTSASTVSCTYEGADPDQGRDAYCLCSSSTYSVLSGTANDRCAYTTLPTATAVITASALSTITQGCDVCTVYGVASKDCTQLPGCTPTSTSTQSVATATSSTTSTAPQETCSLWTECPMCPEGQTRDCIEQTCGCAATISDNARQNSSAKELNGTAVEVNRGNFYLNGTEDVLIGRGDNDGVVALSSRPYEPSGEDLSCTSSGLSKRANDWKELKLPWLGYQIKWSRYPGCPKTGSKGIGDVPSVSPRYSAFFSLTAYQFEITKLSSTVLLSSRSRSPAANRSPRLESSHCKKRFNQGYDRWHCAV